MGRVALNDEDEAYVRRQLESGNYENASEVVRAALRLMEDFEEDRDVWLRETIPGRFEELRQDPSKAVPLEVARASFERLREADASKT